MNSICSIPEVPVKHCTGLPYTLKQLFIMHFTFINNSGLTKRSLPVGS